MGWRFCDFIMINSKSLDNFLWYRQRKNIFILNRNNLITIAHNNILSNLHIFNSAGYKEIFDGISLAG